MIKQAEVQNAYLLGRQAAMEKLAEGPDMGPNSPPTPHKNTVSELGPMSADQMAEYPILDQIAGQGLRDQLGLYTNVGEDQQSPTMRAIRERLAQAANNQAALLGNIGLGSQGLTTGDIDSFAPLSAKLDPRRLATLENLSRAGMLGGAIGGGVLGGDARAAALASAGALGGGILGGNIGQGLDAALGAYSGQGPQYRRGASAIGGALGGLAGGLGAGYMS